MSEISHLLRQGWRNLWKEKIVWLFTLLSSVTLIISIVDSPKDLVGSLLYLVVSVALILLMLAGSIGVITIAYRTTTGETVTLPGVWLVVRKYFARITAFYILSGISIILLITPCICFLAFQLMNSESTQLPGKGTLALIPFLFLMGLFSAIYYLPILEIVAKGSGIRKSIANAWKLFTGHFGLFLGLSLVLSAIEWILPGIYWGIAVYSWNFNLAAAGSLNTQNPFINSANNLFYWLTFIVSQCLFTYYAYVFALAYYEKSNHNNQGRIIPHEQQHSSP